MRKGRAKTSVYAAERSASRLRSHEATWFQPGPKKGLAALKGWPYNLRAGRVDELSQPFQDRLGEVRGLRDVGIDARVLPPHSQNPFVSVMLNQLPELSFMSASTP